MAPIDAGQGKVKRPGTGKWESQHFTLHKLIVLPTRILENNFIAYFHDYDYLALSFNQRDFALLKEDDLKSCSTVILTVCPINDPLYHAKVFACEAEFFFQMSGKTTACIIAANEVRKLPELHGTSQLRTDVPTL